MPCNLFSSRLSMIIFYRIVTANSEVLHDAIGDEQAKKKERHKRENVYMNADVLQTELKHSRGMPEGYHNHSLFV